MPPPTHASTRDSWTLTGRSESVSCGVTATFSCVLVCTGFCYILQECISQSWWSMVGLMAISSKKPHGKATSAAPRAPVPASAHHWPAPPQEMLRQSSVSVSVGSLGSVAHKVCLRPLSISGGNGV